MLVLGPEWVRVVGYEGVQRHGNLNEAGKVLLFFLSIKDIQCATHRLRRRQSTSRLGSI